MYGGYRRFRGWGTDFSSTRNILFLTLAFIKCEEASIEFPFRLPQCLDQRVLVSAEMPF